MLVIDASVLAKYVSREEGWREARRLLSSGAYTVELAVKEAANALWKKALRGEADPAAVPEIAARLYRVVELLDQEEVLREAVEIALRRRVTVYDALYIAAAKKHGAVLATADRRQAEAAMEEGVEVRLLD